ncbi:MAG: TonB-dependent receptor [bacterium]
MKRTILLFSGLFLFLSSALAGDYLGDLGTIVVTPQKGWEIESFKSPNSITVIDKDEIKDSSADNIAELLKYEAGIFIQDVTGNKIKSSVDIRGYGEAAAMNSVILINGRKFNNADISNVDLSQISLAGVERVEIIRGGMSSLYGDGATGGVINIITKTPSGKEKRLGFSYSSFKGADSLFGIDGQDGDLAYFMNFSHRFNQGFRDNNQVESLNMSGQIENRQNTLPWNLFIQMHQDRYGLPGYILQADWEKKDLKKTYTPEDYGKTRDLHSILSTKYGIGNIEGITDVAFTMRDALSFMDSWATYKNHYTRTLSGEQKFQYSDKTLTALGGGEIYDTFYNVMPVAQNLAPTVANDDQNVKRKNNAAFLKIGLFFHPFSIDIGGRRENFKQSIDDESAGKSYTNAENLRALNMGAGFLLTSHLNFYLRFSKAFRMPRSDEYVSWGAYNPALLPQKNTEKEAGLKYQGSNFNAYVSVFHDKIKDEIYYNNTSWLNENYPSPTIRNGAELNFGRAFNEFLDAALSYSYTRGEFESGDYDGKAIPLVPKHKCGIKLGIRPAKNLKINMSANGISDRFFGSDYVQKSKLAGYGVVDMKVTKTLNNEEIFLAVKNIGNKQYCESAYSGTYYPASLRSFTGGISLKF